MLNFFKNIVKSVYNPTFYKELETRSTWASVRYYLGLSVIIAVILGASTAALLSPLVVAFLGQAKPVVLDIYPKDLVITIKSGSAASNVSEPYFIKMPDKMKQFFGATSTINLAVIDTREKADQSKFASFNTLSLVAKDGVMLLKGENGVAGTTFQPYTSDFVMKHDVYVDFVNKVAGFGDKLPIVMLVSLIVGFFLWGVVRMLYLLLAALLVYLMFKARKMPVAYGQSYRIALHAATVPILVNLILAFFTFNPSILSTMPFLFTIILLAVVWFNTRETKAV